MSDSRCLNLATPHNGRVDPLETLEQFRLNPEPNKVDAFYDRELASALHKAGARLSGDHLDEVLHLVARDRPFVIPEIFRKKDLPVAHTPLLNGLDREDHLAWTPYFLREALRRHRVVEASSIYNDIARYTSVPGALKRLSDIVSRHVVDAALLEAIQLSIERPGRLPQRPEGGMHYPIMCAWLAIDGSPRSLESLRSYRAILAASDSAVAGRVSEIVHEYAANDATRAVAHEFTLGKRE